MKKILFFMFLSISFLFSAVNLQTASKDDLMCIKGIGEKKADAIIKYRKSNKLKSASDLSELKGFGEAIIAAVKSGTKTVKCGGKKTTKKTTSSKKSETKKGDTKKSDSSKSDKNKVEKKTDIKKSETKKSDSKKSDSSKSEKKKTDKDSSK